jgi:hypothetical protein
MRDFAKRVIAHDTSQNDSAMIAASVAFPVITKLQSTLTNLMGRIGFMALLSRALALASAEVRWLKMVQITADGVLQWAEPLARQPGPDALLEGPVVLLTHLFQLLVAFIGEKLTLQLVHESWPTLPANDLNFSDER